MTGTSTPSNHSKPSDTGYPTPVTLKKRKFATFMLAGIFLVIGLIWLVYYLVWGQFEVYTDDAYVNGNLVQVMAQVPGTVVEINGDDTYLVNKGQQIAKLDPSDMKIAFQHAQAELAQTVRQVRQAYETADQAQATLILRHADLVKAQLDLKRRTGLLGEKAISREELQHYQTALDTAQAQYNYALHNLHAAQALVDNSHLYTHPQVERAKANFKTAYLNLVRTTIIAPVTGYIAKRSIQVGQQVTVNTPMLAIVPLSDVWVDANYKESQLSEIRIGQPVILTADAYSNITYHGKVVGLNAGTGSAFSLLPAQNATGNWIKIVQRLPVRISLLADELKRNPLQIGLSMRVTTNIHDTSGSRLATTASSKPVYFTDVYTRQLADADRLINRILRDNSPDIYMSASGFPDHPAPCHPAKPSLINSAFANPAEEISQLLAARRLMPKEWISA
jgi:membrane fusion protein (multidrug efflux system)